MTEFGSAPDTVRSRRLYSAVDAGSQDVSLAAGISGQSSTDAIKPYYTRNYDVLSCRFGNRTDIDMRLGLAILSQCMIAS